MTTMKQRKTSIALVALLLILGACKGESPTAPAPGSGIPPGNGGTTPPTTGVSMSLTASNASPVVDSTVTVTAVVTQDGANVPNGTAVEFKSSGGGLDGTTATTLIKTTTNGVATVTLTSTVAGAVTVQATVANVTRSLTVTFGTTPQQPPPVSTAPSITSVSPAIGVPAGGQTIRITGKNFKEPVRVLFDLGGPLPVEGFVVGRTDTTIDVITPGVNLGAGQQLIADITVITQAGTANEQRVSVDDAFTFRLEQLTPRFTTATPNSGPVTGGTMVSILGDGFQAPVQVLFGAAEARVVTVDFSRIVVETPSARDTTPNGSETFTGPVDITIKNLNSQTSVVGTGGFRYIAAMDITSVHPNTGPATGGTDITIDGIGFLAPVDVFVGGQRATVLRVSGSQILARTVALPSPCSPGGGDIEVTNVNNGDTATYGSAAGELGFSFLAINPFITSASPAGGVTPGGSVTVVIRDPGVGPFGSADIRFTMLSRTLIPNPSSITNGTGSTSFTVVTPTTGFVFPTVACTISPGVNGTQLGSVEVPLTFNNLSTSCSDSTTVRINPPGPNACTQPPPSAVVTAPASTACPGLQMGSVTAASGSTVGTITVRNAGETGAATLTVTPSSNNGEFAVSGAAVSVPAGGTRDITVTFDPSATGARTGTITLTTNDPANPTIVVCVTGTGT
jgi:hypothetical protein